MYVDEKWCANLLFSELENLLGDPGPLWPYNLAALDLISHYIALYPLYVRIYAHEHTPHTRACSPTHSQPSVDIACQPRLAGWNPLVCSHSSRSTRGQLPRSHERQGFEGTTESSTHSLHVGIGSHQNSMRTTQRTGPPWGRPGCGKGPVEREDGTTLYDI